ncbi:DrmE family protein [Eubacterium limosum]|uniref:DrmE family protein n=1 Tax=Eubacterium limosum TaxID=1736 RepID=UPI001062F12A|nr:DrmE family protein [Eubacterium limosum]
MKWEEYVNSILENEMVLGNISLSFNGKNQKIPNIIQVSIFFLKKMITFQGGRNILVFPEGKETACLFTVAKFLYSILTGKIHKTYDPTKFRKGQKLKLGNAVVEFSGIELFGGEKYIYINCLDLRYGIPLKDAPHFQETDTHKRLSKNKVFKHEKKKTDELRNDWTDLVSFLEEYKTHLDSSVLYIAPVQRTKKYLNSTLIDGNLLTEMLSIGQVDYSGKVTNVSPGQLSGIPSLLLTPELSYASVLLNQDNHVESVFLDLSSCNIENQLDFLDDILQKDVAFTCIASTASSFELEELKSREFNIWRWNKDSITKTLINATGKIKTEIKSENCRLFDVRYITVESEEICEAFSILSDYREEVEGLSVGFNKMFSFMIHCAYKCLRSIETVSDETIKHLKNKIDKYEDFLNAEQPYISKRIFDDFLKVTELFKIIFTQKYQFPKIAALKEELLKEKYGRISFIVSKDANIEQIRQQWGSLLLSNEYSPSLSVMYPADYLNNRTDDSDIVVIVGWLNKKTMRNILYSYNSKSYLVLLYQYEIKWKNAHIKIWEHSLNNDCNRIVIRESLENRSSNETIDFCIEQVEKSDKPELTDATEQESMDTVLLMNRFKQYATKNDMGDVITACPVSFVGNYFAFFTEGHEVIIATDIIYGEGETIKRKKINGLMSGDFIVIRESSKDIIREVADEILENRGLSKLRSLSEKWKEALNIEKAFSNMNEIIERLHKAGCSKNKATIKNWINSDTVIMPQKKRDLEIIAEITGDPVLSEKMDEIFNAGKIVQGAHIQAGSVLSDKLQQSIAEKLLEQNNIDPFNIWDPLELEIDGIGNIKILKIVGIATSFINVQNSDVNKLMSEDREV